MSPIETLASGPNVNSGEASTLEDAESLNCIRRCLIYSDGVRESNEEVYRPVLRLFRLDSGNTTPADSALVLQKELALPPAHFLLIQHTVTLRSHVSYISDGSHIF